MPVRGTLILLHFPESLLDMSEHLRFHKHCISQPIARLSRDLRLVQHGQQSEIQGEVNGFQCEIRRLHEQTLLVHGRKIK
jgi:hypothetical protein